MGATITSTSDPDLIGRAHEGDADAFMALLDRHLHPAWRIALVVTGDPVTAENAVIRGTCDAFAAVDRSPDLTLPVRARIVAAVRHAALTGGEDPDPVVADDDPVLRAFVALPERWRTALWLCEVEGGTPAQAAPVIGLDRSATGTLVDRARSGLRERLAADLAARAERPECRVALSRLSAHVSGTLIGADRQRVEDHLAGCGACAVWLSALVAPRPALRRLITPLPEGLPTHVADHWLRTVLQHKRRAWLTPWTERAIGAAAAAVMAVGLAGVALLGGRDTEGRSIQTAAKGSAGESAAPPSSSQDVVGEPAGGSTSGTGTSSGSTSSSGAAALQPPRLIKPATPPAAPAPQAPAPAAPTPGAPAPDAPLPAPGDGTQISVSVGGDAGVEIALGDCTGVSVAGTALGCSPASGDQALVVTVDLPLLGPITIG